jgi:hypothetical protein
MKKLLLILFTLSIYTSSYAVPNWLRVAGADAVGALGGAAAGSAIPAIGTVVGGIIGGVGNSLALSMPCNGCVGTKTSIKNAQYNLIGEQHNELLIDNIELSGKSLDEILNSLKYKKVEESDGFGLFIENLKKLIFDQDSKSSYLRNFETIENKSVIDLASNFYDNNYIDEINFETFNKNLDNFEAELEKLELKKADEEKVFAYISTFKHSSHYWIQSK